MEQANAGSAKIDVDGPTDASSPLAPFGDRAFSVLWTATVIANIGTWMQSAAAGWLMTSLDPAPFAVPLRSRQHGRRSFRSWCLAAIFPRLLP